MTFHRAATAACVLMLLASPSLAEDVVMGRYDARQSSYTPEKIELPVALKWEYTGNKFKNNPAAPIVAGNTCFFACGEFVYAVDLSTGSLKWKYPSERGLGGSVKSTPAYYDGCLYFGATDKNLYCLDATTGAFKWAYPVRGSIRCSPVILDGIIYFGADDDSVHSVSAETGDAVWAKPFTSKDDLSGGLAIASGMLISASMDGCLYAISAGTGKLRTYPYRLSQAPTRTSPVIVENVVVMAIGNSMLGLSLKGLQLRWQVTLPGEAAATPAIYGNDVFVPCRDKKIHAYNIGGRQPVYKWTEPIDLGTMPLSSPIVAGDTLYVTGSKGVVAAYSAENGSLKWRYVCAPSSVTAAGSASVDAASSPTAANGAVLVLTDDGVLHCFAPDAPDDEAPRPFANMPYVGSVLSSAPPIKISCGLYDLGSGVDFSKVSMSLDGEPVGEPTVDPATFTVTYITDVGGVGKPIQKLRQGPHTIAVNAQDYKGNLLTYTWFFLTDDSLPPPRLPQPADKGKNTGTAKAEDHLQADSDSSSAAWRRCEPGLSECAPPPPPPPVAAPGAPGVPGSF